MREEKARALIAPWAKYITAGLPYVSLKLALSLDGRIATRTGESKWVTGPEARAKVHLLRAQSDAIAVGIGTALADDPRLTVRDAPGDSPLRIVFDTKLRLPLASRLVQTAREIPTLVLCGLDASRDAEEELAAQGVECLRCAALRRGPPRRPRGAPVARAARHRDPDGRGRRRARRQLPGGAPRGRAPRLRGAHPARARAAAPAPSTGPGRTRRSRRRASPSPAWELVGNDAYVHGPLVYPE